MPKQNKTITIIIIIVIMIKNEIKFKTYSTDKPLHGLVRIRDG